MKKNKNPYSNITVSEFFCTRCGAQGIPIPRRANQQREAGHLKALWCPNCQLTVNHAEVRPFGNYQYEDFKKEFDLGRFVHGQRIPVSELMSCSKADCKYNVDDKCWNSNESFDCGHRPVRGDESNE